jgi:hypothetical protein
MVGDALGSECSTSGFVLPHAFIPWQEAVGGFFPKEYAWSPAPFETFRSLAQHVPADRFQAVFRFIQLVEPLEPQFAYLGGADFRPHAHDRGSFYLAIHLDQMGYFGWRVLIAFPRVET